jgi:predicted nucleic acid-binding protein
VARTSSDRLATRVRGYDGLYVSLAVASKATLVTADERMANALAAHFPVRWLGAIDLA